MSNSQLDRLFSLVTTSHRELRSGAGSGVLTIEQCWAVVERISTIVQTSGAPPINKADLSLLGKFLSEGGGRYDLEQLADLLSTAPSVVRGVDSLHESQIELVPRPGG